MVLSNCRREADMIDDNVPYVMGRDAWNSGKRTIEEARAANPYQGFGQIAEHARFVAFNKGWNEAKKASEE